MFTRKPRPQINLGDGTERRAGLTNYASSCYMNSTLQAMAACQPLQDLLAPTDTVILESSPSLRTIAGEEDLAQHLEALPISSAWISLLRQLYKSQANQKTISTSKLHKVLSRKNPDYDGISQQDAHEALLAMLDQVRLEEVDLIKAVQPPPKPARPAPKARQGTATPFDPSGTSTAASDESSSASSDSEPEEAEPDSKNKLQPFIDTLFDGSLKSFIVCDTCKNVSISKEPFIDLSLAIQSDPKPRRRSRLKSMFTRDHSGASSSTGAASDRPAANPLSRVLGNSSNANTENSTEEAVDSSDSDDNEAMAQSMPGLHHHHPADAGKPKRRGSLDPSSLRERWSRRSSRKPSISHGGSDSERSRQQASRRPPGSAGPRFPFDATAPMSEPDEETSHSSPMHARNFTKAEDAYLKTVLAAVPTKSPQQASPLDRLRVARPGGSRMAVGPSNAEEAAQQHSPVSPSHSSSEYEYGTSDLYKALQKFTAVEILEGENAFQCKKCWKLANPQFTRAKKVGQEHVSLPYAPNSGTLKNGHKLSGLVAQLGLESDTEDEARGGANSLRAEENEVYTATPDNQMTTAASSDADSSSNASDGSADADSEGDLDDSTAKSKQTTAPGVPYVESAKASLDTTPSQSANSSIPATPRKPPKSERHIPRKAHKRYLIDQLPKVLIMHFNRFQQTKPSMLAASLGGPFFNSLRPAPKIGKPLPESNMSTERDTQSENPHAPSSAQQPQTSGRARKRSSTIVPETPLEADPRLSQCNYRLVAVVVHSGSMAGGHYISYVNVPVDNSTSSKAPSSASGVNESATPDSQNDPITSEDATVEQPAEKQWLYCSDEEIRPAHEAEVMNCKAYLLYYERIDN